MSYLRHLTALIALSLGLLCAPVGAEELTPEKRADIERLLEMTNSLSIGRQMGAAMANNMTQVLKKARPDIPQKVLDTLPAEVMATFDENADSLMAEFIPIYHKYFTASEVKEMIRFYSTELGQKTIKVMPALMQEGMVVGKRWGEALGPRVKQRVTSKLKQQGFNI